MLETIDWDQVLEPLDANQAWENLLIFLPIL